MRSNTYIFHHDDLDGISSAFIINEFVKNAIIISCNYENKISPFNIIDKEDRVILVDYSFEPEIMKKIYRLLKDNFIWIDHHASAINKSKKFGYDNISGLRDMNYCGAELSYIYYQNDNNIPSLIKEIGNFDLFRTFGTSDFEITLSVFYACMAFQDILKQSIKKIIKYKKDEEFYNFFKGEGHAIYCYEKIRYKDECKKYAYVRKIWNKKVLCMNTTESALGLQISKTFNPEKHDMILTYNFDGKHWNYGFYTDKNRHPEVNCAEIAELYGGGGHPQASGAQLDYIFQELIEGNN